MHQDLKDRNAIVTGSGKRSGIGFGIARELARRGANVMIADLGNLAFENYGVKTGNREEMDSIAEEFNKEFGVKCLAVDLDVTDKKAIASMVETAQSTWGNVHILCNNAGATFGVPNLVHTYDEDAWMKTLDINLHSVFRISRAVLPLMLEVKGCIVNTASRAGKVPPIFNGAYAVAKAGVIMLTKVMAKELGGMGVRVNCVCPAQIMTDLERWRFEQESQFLGEPVEKRIEEMCTTIPLNRIGEPAEVGKTVAFLASDQASYLTGQAINVCGGQLMEL